METTDPNKPICRVQVYGLCKIKKESVFSYPIFIYSESIDTFHECIELLDKSSEKFGSVEVKGFMWCPYYLPLKDDEAIYVFVSRKQDISDIIKWKVDEEK